MWSPGDSRLYLLYSMHSSISVYRYTGLGVHTRTERAPRRLSLACKFGTRYRCNLASCPIARHRSSNFVHAMALTSAILELWYRVETRRPSVTMAAKRRHTRLNMTVLSRQHRKRACRRSPTATGLMMETSSPPTKPETSKGD